jgi:hypothetical protein
MYRLGCALNACQTLFTIISQLNVNLHIVLNSTCSSLKSGEYAFYASQAALFSQIVLIVFRQDVVLIFFLMVLVLDATQAISLLPTILAQY